MKRLHGAETSHQGHGKTKQTTRLVLDHLFVRFHAGTCGTLSPCNVLTLTTMKIQKLTQKHLGSLGVVQNVNLLQSQKVNVIRRVDRVRDTVHFVSTRNTSSHRGSVLDIIDQK